MFLNLHSRNQNRLSLEPNFSRQKTYLSSLSKLNKEKSYSTSSLKEQFRQFKNKSLSHAYSSNSSLSQIKPQVYSPINAITKGRASQFNSCSFIGNGSKNGLNMKPVDFKKSYLNLDSKLNKCTKPKDYFKPIHQSTPVNYNNASHIEIPSSYIEAQKRLQKQNTRRSIALIDEITRLKQQNEILHRQNQELRKQRIIDLELIARQNQIMQKQQELIEVNQQAVYINKCNQKQFLLQNDSRAYTFSNNQNIVNLSPHQCEQCLRKNKQNIVQSQFIELKLQKIEEQKKLLKKQIHDLVYQCEKYKESLKKTEQKYQKELQHNQKLINIIYNSQKRKDFHHNKKSLNEINRQPYLNLKLLDDNSQLNTPVSIKRSNGKIQQRQNQYEQKSEVTSPTKKLEKSTNYKSAVNLIKYNDCEIKYDKNWQLKHDNAEEQSRIKKFVKQKQKQKQKVNDLEWCQNQNIRKYLQEINKQKIKQIAKIEYLLSNQ